MERIQRTHWTSATPDPALLPQAVREAVSRMVATSGPGRRPGVFRAPVIVVDGRSGSGKTTFATAVAAFLDDRLRRAAGSPGSGPIDEDEPLDRPTERGPYDRVRAIGDVQVAHLDDWYEGWSGLAAATATTERILAEDPSYVRWDWDTDSFADTVRLDPLRPVVIEGAGSLTERTARDSDLRIWIDAPADERKARALARDGAGYEPFWDMWSDQEERHVSERHPQDLADIFVRTDDPGNAFDAATDTYQQVRPAYPAESVEAMVVAARESLGREPVDAVDIGAGTGKMTVQLIHHELRVTAVEPAEAMRRQLDPALVNIVDASAEDTGLPTSSFDLAVFAQSWHWVDPARASREMHRILRERGVLAAVWNQMDVEVDWVHRLTRIMRSGDVHSPTRPPRFGKLFSDPELHEQQWSQAMTPEQILLLGQTRSSYLRADADGRERMQANLTWYLYRHLGHAPGDRIEVPYRTMTWTARAL